MKVRFVIEFDTDDDGTPTKMKVKRALEVAAVPPGAVLEPKLAKIAETVTPVTPVKRPGSGPQFAPGFVEMIRTAHEPFTRLSIAAVTGLTPADVTLRLNRMKHKGWIEQPVKTLWRKTKNFGVKS